MIILHSYYAGKNYNPHSWIIQYLIFHKHFQRINGRKDNHSFNNHSVQKNMSILLIVVPRMEGFIIQAATKKP